jgi:hypothetical protein
MHPIIKAVAPTHRAHVGRGLGCEVDSVLDMNGMGSPTRGVGTGLRR